MNSFIDILIIQVGPLREFPNRLLSGGRHSLHLVNLNIETPKKRSSRTLNPKTNVRFVVLKKFNS